MSQAARPLKPTNDLTTQNALKKHLAKVAELADALDSGSSARKGVEVRVLFFAQMLGRTLMLRWCSGTQDISESPAVERSLR